MPGVRIDRFLASTAIVLLLSASTGSAFAEPKFGSIDSAPPPAAATPHSTIETEQPAAAESEPMSEPAAPAAASKPQTSAEKPLVAMAKSEYKAEYKSEEDMTGQAPPATTAAPDEPAEQPAEAPPAADVPAPSEPAEQPTATVPPPAPAAAQPAPAAVTEAPAAAQPAPAGPEAPAATPAPATQPATATGSDKVPAAAPPAAASGEAATATPSAVADDANTPIAQQLRELANGKFDRILGGKKERPSFEAFYAARDYAPLWFSDGKVNARAKEAIAYLGQVDAGGLDPADYPVPNFSSSTDPAALAEAEMRLTASVVTYAHHASVGRVHWSRVSSDILYDLKPPAPADVLAAVADAKDVAATLASYEPQTPNYIALKAKLAELRGGKEAKAPIASGPAPRIGAPDDRVPQLRERLGLDGDSMIYDKALADAVKKFQQEHELKVSGLLTPQTIEALNGRQPDRPIDTILVNLERWRWMPHDLGKNYVIVNLPDYTLRVFHDGKQVWMTRIVAGKPNMPTPIMSTEMKYITVNPTWNVPPSIVAREYLPALAQDPTVLSRMGLRVSTNPDGTIHISQPPGDANALGRLRFNFPNKFLVYQHDTPNKNLFALDKRALSHGCMRVQDPVKYAEVLLSIVRPGEAYTQERIRKMFSEGEQDIQFPKFVPVHLTYQTAFVDEAGNLEFREDIYGRDKVLLAILKGDERRVADIQVEHHENAIRREALAIPDQQSYYGGRGYYSGYPGGGGNFFSRLFGGFGDQQYAPQPRNRAAQRRQEIH